MTRTFLTQWNRKTLTSLAIMLAYQQTEWPLLILCPASLRYTWPAEIEKFCPWIPSQSIHVVRGKGEVNIFSGLIFKWKVNPSKSGNLLLFKMMCTLQRRFTDGEIINIRHKKTQIAARNQMRGLILQRGNSVQFKSLLWPTHYYKIAFKLPTLLETANLNVSSLTRATI